MGFLGKIIKLSMDVIELPIAVVKDVLNPDGDKSYTVEKFEELDSDIEEILM
jgi:hypothetical protein